MDKYKSAIGCLANDAHKHDFLILLDPVDFIIF